MEQQRLPLPTTDFRVQAPASRQLDTPPQLAAPIELELSQLVHVAGGTTAPSTAPNSKW